MSELTRCNYCNLEGLRLSACGAVESALSMDKWICPK